MLVPITLADGIREDDSGIEVLTFKELGIIWYDGQKACRKTEYFVKQLKEQIAVAERIVEQSKQVVSGNKNIVDRVVSHFDIEARPIKKEKTISKIHRAGKT
ncbi:hypothetical protein [Calderihabitans maritimus]|uniref:Transposase n=1 Tax=Calderihabitans maritimus TaxID=1246530 RepID=A0A1Z5HSZ7_9FIRM|nr:transposase [Calderihabitans maritimus]